MTFLIVKVLTPELTQKAVRIDLNSPKTTFDVSKILKDNSIKFVKILKWDSYSVQNTIVN